MDNHNSQLTDFRVGHFHQKYVSISETEGAVELPCWFVRPGGSLTNSIKVEGMVANKYSSFLGGKTELRARLQDGRPDGFSWFVNGQPAHNYIPVALNNGHFSLSVDVRLDNPELIADGQLVRCHVQLDLLIENSRMGKHTSEVPYLGSLGNIDFFVHKEIGRAWVGFDPGTTGSCVAFGTTGGSHDNPNITLVHQEDGNVIIPSKLALDRPINKAVNDLQPDIDYSYGQKVEDSWDAYVNAGVPVFQSIKKLLGYKNADGDLVQANVAGRRMEFTGLELAHLLVKGLKHKLDRNIEEMSPSQRSRYLGKEEEARRAVVALPNNYTLPKILEMVDSVRMLGNFEEVRYIYEAEGVLFNYLRKNFKNARPGAENVMVYDMGGATINVTIFNVQYYLGHDGSMYYHISTLGRLGYAVGGDNIDYAMMEYIYNRRVEQPQGQKANHKHQIDNKNRILARMLELKKEVIYSCMSVYDKTNVLQTEANYSMFINNIVNGLGTQAKTIRENSATKGNIGIRGRAVQIIESDELEEYVYSNIRDAIHEILQFPEVANLQNIDTIIFSGRSTLYPKVKYAVLSLVANRFPYVSEYKGFSPDEIKTSVAYGACWYGIYNSLITVDNSRLTSAFGFKITMNGATHFYTMLDQNSCYDDGGRVTMQVDGIHNSFASDGNVVDFYQVSGSGRGANLFAEGNRHKLSPIGTVDVPTQVESIFMSVDRSNTITCKVIFDNGTEETIDDMQVAARDILKENDPAYVFATYAPVVDQPVQEMPRQENRGRRQAVMRESSTKDTVTPSTDNPHADNPGTGTNTRH